MGKRERYEPGTFSWVDLATTDIDGSKSFYAMLFGWNYHDQVGEGLTYSLAQLGADRVTAMLDMSARAAEQGVPAHWNSYVTVDSADAFAERAQSLGGQVAVHPHDVLDVGRRSTILDPGGAALVLWQPRTTIGATVFSEPGTLCWNDLATRSFDAALTFYGELFDWDFEQAGTEGGGRYAVVRRAGANETPHGGIRELGDGEAVEDGWIPYFAAEDRDRAVKAARGAGAEAVIGPAELPAGRAAVVRDPAGALFGILELARRG